MQTNKPTFFSKLRKLVLPNTFGQSITFGLLLYYVLEPLLSGNPMVLASEESSWAFFVVAVMWYLSLKDVKKYRCVLDATIAIAEKNIDSRKDLITKCDKLISERNSDLRAINNFTNGVEKEFLKLGYVKVSEQEYLEMLKHDREAIPFVKK